MALITREQVKIDNRDEGPGPLSAGRSRAPGVVCGALRRWARSLSTAASSYERLDARHGVKMPDLTPPPIFLEKNSTTGRPGSRGTVQLYTEMASKIQMLLFRNPTAMAPPQETGDDNEDMIEREMRKLQIQEVIEKMDQRLKDEILILGIACLVRSHTNNLCQKHDSSSELETWKQHSKIMNIILHCRDRWDETMHGFKPFPTLRSYFRKLAVHMIHKYLHQNHDSRVSIVHLPDTAYRLM